MSETIGGSNFKSQSLEEYKQNCKIWLRRDRKFEPYISAKKFGQSDTFPQKNATQGGFTGEFLQLFNVEMT
jgi:hypothetical protein